MPRLTAAQIRTGSKNATDIGPKQPAPYIRDPATGRRLWVRRWRCCLCHPTRWRAGTPADALTHYQLVHQDQE